MLDIRGWRHFTQVLVPGALPSIFTGLRLSLQASWTTLVAAELVGAIAGLGQILNQGAQDIYPPMILVGMMSVALCGWLMTLGLGWLEARAMPWRTDDAHPQASPPPVGSRLPPHRGRRLRPGGAGFAAPARGRARTQLSLLVVGALPTPRWKPPFAAARRPLCSPESGSVRSRAGLQNRAPLLGSRHA